MYAGIDECGRGALAGPVVAAAVVWNPDVPPNGIKDSKKLSAKKRQELAKYIREHALDYAVSFVNSEVIDNKNILQATFDAMHDCVSQIEQRNSNRLEHLFVDGNCFRPFTNIPHTCIVQGDNVRTDIAAASILAKVSRDEHMDRLPMAVEYDFVHNKGYGTAKHLAAIQTHGLSSEHRRSFRLKNVYLQ